MLWEMAALRPSCAYCLSLLFLKFLLDSMLLGRRNNDVPTGVDFSRDAPCEFRDPHINRALRGVKFAAVFTWSHIQKIRSGKSDGSAFPEGCAPVATIFRQPSTSRFLDGVVLGAPNVRDVGVGGYSDGVCSPSRS